MLILDATLLENNAVHFLTANCFSSAERISLRFGARLASAGYGLALGKMFGMPWVILCLELIGTCHLFAPQLLVYGDCECLRFN